MHKYIELLVHYEIWTAICVDRPEKYVPTAKQSKQQKNCSEKESGDKQYTVNQCFPNCGTRIPWSTGTVHWGYVMHYVLDAHGASSSKKLYIFLALTITKSYVRGT